MKQKTDKEGRSIFDENGKPVMIQDYISVTAGFTREAEREKTMALLNKKGKPQPLNIILTEANDNLSRPPVLCCRLPLLLDTDPFSAMPSA